MSLRHLFEELDIPYTRDEAIDFNWMGDPPEPWTAEDEMELPEELQDWSLFEEIDGELVAKDFDESKHPRDDHGRFTDGGGDESSPLSLMNGPEAYHFFHGTAESLVASIKEHGLVPTGEQPAELGHAIDGADKWARDHHMSVGTHNIGDRKASVYLATDPVLAAAFAKVVTQVHPDTKPVVLAIKIPKAEVDSHLAMDEQSSISDAYRFTGKIKPEWIVDVGTFDPNTIPDIDPTPTMKKLETNKNGDVVVHAVILVKEDEA